MNVYADRGNLIAIRYRAAEYGIALQEFDVSLGDPLPPEADLVLIGGAQDREQHRIAHELADRGDTLRDWAEHDTAMLTVCGGFQLFGRWYRDKNGIVLPGAALFDTTTVAPGQRADRAVGDILIESTLPEVGPSADRDPDVIEIVGFENHAGRTYLGPTARPFGYVRYGLGNNGDDGSEGAIYRQAIGTYLHGSILPKNPRLLDHFLAAALTHHLGEPVTLPALPAPYADRAHDAAVQIARTRAPARH
jgi:CobQ-like glutamine amidotransferase family enzyme